MPIIQKTHPLLPVLGLLAALWSCTRTTAPPPAPKRAASAPLPRFHYEARAQSEDSLLCLEKALESSRDGLRAMLKHRLQKEGETILAALPAEIHARPEARRDLLRLLIRTEMRGLNRARIIHRRGAARTDGKGFRCRIGLGLSEKDLLGILARELEGFPGPSGGLNAAE